MSRRRYDTSGVALPDDPTPELPLALPGLVEPHALLTHLRWTDLSEVTVESVAEAEEDAAISGLGEEYSVLADVVAAEAGKPRVDSDEFDTLELSDIEHELVEVEPPPAPASVKITPVADDEPTVTESGERAAESPVTVSSTDERAAPTDAPVQPIENRAERKSAPKQARPVKIDAAPKPSQPPDEVDDLMSELLEGDKEPDTRKTEGERWWAEVFDATYLRLLPDSFHRRTLREADFLVGAIAPPAGGRLLDVACGYGRHAIELASRGYSVVGVDQGRALLERAFSESERRKLGIEFLLGDMRELDFDDAFDGVYCWHSSFGFFDDATNLRVARLMAAAVRPGGRVVIEQVNRDHIVQACPRRLWWERDELVVMEDITFDHRTSRLCVERSIVDETQRPWEQHMSVRLYAVHELEELMVAAGLEVLGTSGDIAHPGVYLGPENRSVIVTARKPG